MHSQLSERITPARSLRRTIAALAAAAVLLAAPAARAAFLPLPAKGSQVNDDPADAIDPRQDAGVSDVAGGAVMAGKVQVPWATFEQKVCRRRAADLRPRVQERRLGDAGVPRVAQHRPDPGGRSTVDRLRRRGTHGSVGRLVRAERGLRSGRRTSSPAASTRRPTSGCPPARAAARSTPVPQHPSRSHRRAPLGRGRRRRRGQRSGSVDHVGGERRRPRTTARRCGRSSWRRR